MEKRKLIIVSDVNDVIKVLEQFKLRLGSLSANKVKIKDIAEKFVKYGVVMTIQVGEKTAGFSAFYCNDKETKCAFLSMIAVDALYTKSGIGRMLIHETQMYCRKSGMKKLRLEVSDLNTGAIDFYKKLGFLICGKAGMDSKFMEIEL